MHDCLIFARRLTVPFMIGLVIVLLCPGVSSWAQTDGNGSPYPKPDPPMEVWVDIMPGHNPNILDPWNFKTLVPDGRVPENVEVAWKAGPEGTWKRTEIDVIILGGPGFDVVGMDYASIFVCCCKPTGIYRGDFMSPPTDLDAEFPQCQWGADGFEDLWLRVVKEDLWLDCAVQPAEDGDTVIVELRGPHHSEPQIKGHDHVVKRVVEDGIPIEGGTEARSGALGACYPNPFNPVTSFAVTLSRAGEYEVEIFSVQGRLVKTLAGHAAAGTTTITWDGTDAVGRGVASGLYFYRLRAEDVLETRKMLLLK